MAEEVVTFERGDGATALSVLDEMLPLYREVYAEPPYAGNPLNSDAAFLARTRRQVDRPNFTIVQARVGGTLIGFSFGFTIGAGSWWAGSADLPPGEILSEPKFAVIELILAKPRRGHGIGKRLLDDLLHGRPERYAMLTAVADAPARRLYERWGWRQLGTAQHKPDAHRMDQLVRELRPSTGN